jgi:hypothetical protein|tara:strand:+ start:5432 stop:6733 length:1302 start_codon:yes stop_codon:yes gene_type:complete
MTKTITAPKKFDCENILGRFGDESHYELLVDYDCDFYAPTPMGEENSEENIIFKFRKNFFSQEQQDEAYKGLREAAGATENRGLAAGIEKTKSLGSRDWVTNYHEELLAYFQNPSTTLDGSDPVENIKAKWKGRENIADDSRGNVWLALKVAEEAFEFEAWVEEIRLLPKDEMVAEANRVRDKLTSTTSYANQVFSGIAGYFDRYPRIPFGRPTTYTRDNYDKFEMALPFLQQLSKGFEDLLPVRYGKQNEACGKLDSKFIIPGTVFTTATVNKTFRTAYHRDAGDLNEGFSNLTVVSNNGKYSGGHLILPEYKVAVNIRPGDLLLINNHDGIHGNTPMVMESDDAERISFVCYFREKMLELGSWDYERAREDYVTARRTNKEHPLQRKLWNGISPGMWDESEWYDFLENKLGIDVLTKYHPDSQSSSLEEFF